MSINKKSLNTLEKICGEKLTLSSLILSIRKGEEITQVSFAKKLGVSRQYLCDIEHNRRSVSPKMAEKFAKILGYSQEQFVRLCLQDLMAKEGIDMIVNVTAA
jgi:transcriptional regulator with XRE-family HTH domain